MSRVHRARLRRWLGASSSSGWPDSAVSLYRRAIFLPRRRSPRVRNPARPRKLRNPRSPLHRSFRLRAWSRPSNRRLCLPRPHQWRKQNLPLYPSRRRSPRRQSNQLRRLSSLRLRRRQCRLKPSSRHRSSRWRGPSRRHLPRLPYQSRRPSSRRRGALCRRRSDCASRSSRRRRRHRPFRLRGPLRESCRGLQCRA